MGKVLQGINGPISGKVGNIVFYTSNGGNYARSLPYREKKKQPPTLRQALQRYRFAVLQRWLTPLVPLIRTGFKNYAPQQTGHNAAMSYNLKNSIIKTETGFPVNPETFAFSAGFLPGAMEATVIQEGEKARFRWGIDNYLYRDHELDRTMLLLYQPHLARINCSYHVYGAARRDYSDTISLQDLHPGEICHAYIAFISPKTQEVSDSSYLGLLEIKPF